MVEKKFCTICKKELNEDDNFCSNCGNALTESARTMIQERDDLVKIQFVNKLVDVVSDEKTLQILKKITEQLKK